MRSTRGSTRQHRAKGAWQWCGVPPGAQGLSGDQDVGWWTAPAPGSDVVVATVRTPRAARTPVKRGDASVPFTSGASGSSLRMSIRHSTTDLQQRRLSGETLTGATLTEADLREADLARADLTGALLLETNFEGADLTGCFIYGISAWNLKLAETKQLNIVITPAAEPEITVDNLEVAQFIYLLLHNEKIREVIDTIASKAVLILGRFTPKRKGVLDAIREELRRRNYLPIMFDFEKPTSRGFTETVSTLAHMARFIIADITGGKSIPQELQRIIPDLSSVPVQPLLQASAKEYGTFQDFKRYPWVLETYRYKNVKEVTPALMEKVIAPAEVKARELVGPMKR